MVLGSLDAEKGFLMVNEDFMIKGRLIVVKSGHQSCNVCGRYVY